MREIPATEGAVVHAPLSALWTLDPAVRFLNHGSFGAAPRVVLDAQLGWRTRLERQPVRFFVRELDAALAEARASLGGFIGAPADDLAFVPNATAGVNAVLRSLAPSLRAGDELLTTDHEYNACGNALAFVAQLSGTAVTTARVPFPLSSPEEVVSAVLAAVTPRTKLALLDHITSPTALVWPIARLVAELDARGVDTLVDGAHAAGMVPLDLRAIGAAYYTGNCHKWLCAPKGAAFLYVRADHQSKIRPLSISHGATRPRRDVSAFRQEFDWTGTADPTAYLCVPAAIEFLGSMLPGGAAAVMEANRALALEGRRLLCDALGTAPPAPESMIASFAS